MNKGTLAVLCLGFVLGTAAAAEAQVPYYTYYGPTDYVAYYPPAATVYTPPAPVVAYRPVAPTVVYRPTTVVSYRVAPPPVVTYRPVTAYSAGYAPAYVAPAPGPVYVGRQKYYVPFQPVRNVLRALTPGVPVYAY